MNRAHTGSSHASDLMGLLIGLVGMLCIWIGATRYATPPQPSIPAAQSQAASKDGFIRWFSQREWIHEQDWEGIIQDSTPVLLIHGLDEPGGIWDDAAPALAHEGYQVLRFDYPNDQAIHTSAKGLHKALTRLHEQGITKLNIVAHSMGGLIARESLTHPQMGDSTGSIASIRINRLILCGTPNEGSPWAKLRAVGDLRERVYKWIASEDLDPTIFTSLSDDGDGEAGVDLLPDSEFLVALNAREMPESVKTTCIVARIVEPIATSSNPKLDQAANTLGDGVVAVESATLDSCEDIVQLTANHRTMLRTIIFEEGWRTMVGSEEAPEPPAIRVILDRLGQDH